MELNFDYFNNWVKETLNIDLNAYREKQLRRRITTVMKGAGASSLEEYATLISKNEEIKRIFLDYITINVTEFFRNKEIFNEFESVITDLLIPRFKSIRLWSAACSNGAEPYSLAIILDKYKLIQKDKILATDIDDGILAKAKKVYIESMK